MNTILDSPITATVAEEHTGKIHVRVRQRGRKWITTVEGIDDDLDLARIAKAMKRSFHCAATVTQDEFDDTITVIKLQGDHRDDVRMWLVANEVLTEKEADERVVLHGA